MSDLGRSLGRLAIHQTRRDRARVDSDYNLGRWRELLAGKDWLKTSSLESYLFGEGTKQIVAKIDKRIVRIRTDAYYRWRAARLQAVLGSYSDTADCITELGCGYGYNLFSLTISNRYKHLRGFDISVNAIQAAKEIAQHFEIRNVEFNLIDLKDCHHPSFQRIGRQLVFTYYCLEQMPYETEMVIKNLLAARPERVIHIEPTTELLEPWKPLDLVNYLYILSMDYQRTLVRTINRMREEKQLRIIEVTRPGYAPSIRHDPVVIVWEPI